MRYISTFFIFYICCLGRAHSRTLRGAVIKVYDGDTITLQNNIKVRLAEIDTPEIRQNYGIQARDYLHRLLLNKNVRIEWAKKDRYGRIIGDVYLDNININYLMVETGNAWHYKKYSKSSTLRETENKARFHGIGLWGDSARIPPWEFRKQSFHRKSKRVKQLLR